MGAHDEAAVGALCVQAQSLLLPRRRAGPAAPLHRQRRRAGGRQQADPRQGGRRRRRSRRPLSALRQLHAAEGERGARQVQGPVVELGVGIAGRALPQSQRRRSRVAQARPRRAIPPRAVARHRSRRYQPDGLSGPRHRRRQHRAGAEPAVRRILSDRMDRLRHRPGQSAAGRYRVDQPQQQQSAHASGWAAARDHHSDDRPESGGGRCARVDRRIPGGRSASASSRSRRSATGCGTTSSPARPSCRSGPGWRTACRRRT